MFDIKIDGGTVIDGTGRGGSRTDIGIRDETIVAVGDLSRETAGRRSGVSWGAGASPSVGARRCRQRQADNDRGTRRPHVGQTHV